MPSTQDIKLNESHNLFFVGGDFCVADSDNAHIADILTAHKGHYRNAPLIGVGIALDQNMPTSNLEIARLKKRISLQLELDGYRITSLHLNPAANQTQIQIQAHR